MHRCEKTLAVPAASLGFSDDVVCSTVPVAGLPPLFIEPATRELAFNLPVFAAWLADHLDAVEALLLERGALVLRGFPVRTTEDFETVLANFQPHAFGYAGGAALRAPIKGQVMEATRMDQSFTIPVHQEMSYLPNSPRLVAFFCRKAAATGGETTVANMRMATQGIPRPLLQKLKQLGVRYVRNLLAPDVADDRTQTVFCHNNWEANFGTDDRARIEDACADRDLLPEWLEDGSLNLVNRRPAVTNHPRTGDELYFSHVHAQAQHVLAHGAETFGRIQEVYGEKHPRAFDAAFGDGTPLSDAEIEAIYDAIDEASVVFSWRDGDVMLVENKMTGHGRQPFTGTRDVQVALLD